MAVISDEAQHAKLRAETVCRGCGKPKETAMVFCWGCFKYRDNPFKYKEDCSPLDWLREIGGDTNGLDDDSSNDVFNSLVELHDWMRSHTGPKDGTHEMLVRSHNAIEAAKGGGA